MLLWASRRPSRWIEVFPLMLLDVISLLMRFVTSRLCRRLSIVRRASWGLFDLEGQVWWRPCRRLWRGLRFEGEAEFVNIFLVRRRVVRLTLIVFLMVLLLIALWASWWMEVILLVLRVSRVFIRNRWRCPYRIGTRRLLIRTSSLRTWCPLKVIEVRAPSSCWSCFIRIRI